MAPVPAPPAPCTYHPAPVLLGPRLGAALPPRDRLLPAATNSLLLEQACTGSGSGTRRVKGLSLHPVPDLSFRPKQQQLQQQAQQPEEEEEDAEHGQADSQDKDVAQEGTQCEVAGWKDVGCYDTDDHQVGTSSSESSQIWSWQGKHGTSGVQSSTTRKPRLGKHGSKRQLDGSLSKNATSLYSSVAHLTDAAAIGEVLDSWAAPEPLCRADLLGLIKLLGRDGDWRKAISVFSWMRGQAPKLMPDGAVIAVMFRILGKAAQVETASQLFDSFKLDGHSLDVYVYTSLISVHARFGSFQQAIALFERMKSEGCCPNVVTYNVVMDAYGKKGQSWDRILALYNDMKVDGLQPDIYTYNTMINACKTGGSSAVEASRLFLEMKAVGCKPDSVTYNALLDVYGKAGWHDQATSLVEEMGKAGCQPNVVTFNAVIAALGKAGRCVEAANMKQTMLSVGLQPDVVTYSTLISAYSWAGQVSQARETFSEMQTASCTPNCFIFNALIAMYGKNKLLGEMMAIFKQMEECGCEPDIVTWNTLLGVFGKNEMITEVKQVFKDMKECGCEPDKATFNILIDAYGRCGSSEQALQIYKGMLMVGCSADQATYNSLVAALAREGRWEEVEQVVEEMEGGAFKPNDHTHASMLHAYANGGEKVVGLESGVGGGMGSLHKASFVSVDTCTTLRAMEAGQDSQLVVNTASMTTAPAQQCTPAAAACGRRGSPAVAMRSSLSELVPAMSPPVAARPGGCSGIPPPSAGPEVDWHFVQGCMKGIVGQLQRMAQPSPEMEQVGHTLQEMEARLTHRLVHLEGVLGGKMGSLLNRVSHFGGRIEELSEQMDVLEQKVDHFSGQLQAVSDMVENVEARNEMRFTDAMAMLKGGIAAVEGRAWARTVNACSSKAGDRVEPVPDENMNIPHNFPKVVEDIVKMSEADLDGLLEAYGLPDDGASSTRRIRLANYLGLRVTLLE